MTLEIARRLVGGRWRTGIADEGGGGGGSSPLSVVGPFAVTYTELTGFNPTTGFVVTSFDEGTIILDVWAAPVTKWDILDMSFQLNLYNPDYLDFVSLYNSAPRLNDDILTDFPADHVTGGNGWDVNQNQAFNAGDGLFLPARVKAGGCDLVATVDSKTGTPTQGEVNIYALVYVPA